MSHLHFSARKYKKSISRKSEFFNSRIHFKIQIFLQINHNLQRKGIAPSVKENAMPLFFPVLRKHILSPKYISSVPHSLSPWVNQFPHTHSAETETHIHFCPKSAETFDLLGFFRQQRDRLHMARYLLIDVWFCTRSRKHILSKRKHVHSF
jgi:hypothetical protein